jgi:hypothetical protein
MKFSTGHFKCKTIISKRESMLRQSNLLFFHSKVNNLFNELKNLNIIDDNSLS